MFSSLHETPTTPHPLFPEADNRQYWQQFAHNDELLIACLYDEANARLFDAKQPDYLGDLYRIEILCNDDEMASLLASAYYACDLKRGAA